MRTALIFLLSEPVGDSQDPAMRSHRNTNTSAPASISIADYLAAHCQEAEGAPDRVERILQLAAAGAWTDAALALLELEQPEWKLRRLVHEDGEWICSLSRRPDLPIELDDAAEAHNQLLPLAILDALGETRDKDAPVRGKERASNAGVPSAVTPACDNFG
jgi:hypothetical protein